MAKTYTLDQIVAETLREHGYHLPESDNTGLRANPPTIRVQQDQGDAWLILDVDRWLDTVVGFEHAIHRATEILGKPGLVYVVGEFGQIRQTRYVDGTPPPPARHVEPAPPITHVDPPAPQPKPAAAPVPISHVSVSPVAQVSHPDDPTVVQPEIKPEQVVAAMGDDWMKRMQAAKDEGSSEKVREGVQEAFHVLHALHPVLKEMGPVLQAIMHAMGH